MQTYRDDPRYISLIAQRATAYDEKRPLDAMKTVFPIYHIERGYERRDDNHELIHSILVEAGIGSVVCPLGLADRLTRALMDADIDDSIEAAGSS